MPLKLGANTQHHDMLSISAPGETRRTWQGTAPADFGPVKIR
jgi:hypothetical protein